MDLQRREVPRAAQLQRVLRVVAFLKAYIDTVVLYVPTLRAGDRTKLELEYGRRVSIKRVWRWDATLRWDEDSRRLRRVGWVCIGFKIFIQTPKPGMLRLLDELQREYGGTLRRVDISFDWQPHWVTHGYLTQWIKQHLRLRHRQAAPISTEFAKLVYFAPGAHTEKHSMDNVVYGDRPSKRGGTEPINKNEPRFRGVYIVRKLGVNYAGELIDLNPEKVFADCFDVSQTFDPQVVEAQVKKAIRESLQAERVLHIERERRRQRRGDNRTREQRVKEAARLERYRAGLLRRTQAIWAKMGLDYLQRVSDRFPSSLVPSRQEISVDRQLSWDAKARKSA